VLTDKAILSIESVSYRVWVALGKDWNDYKEEKENQGKKASWTASLGLFIT